VTILLELEEVSARYGAIQALHGISFSLEESSTLALLGANGAGKTTTLRAVSGLVRKTGEVRLDGRRISHRSAEAIARLGVAHVPQGRGILGELTVEENLRLGAYARRDRGAIRADLEGVYGHFPRLQERGRQAAGTLSGGEQQMLALGRALLQRPRLLMLDEPSLGLAPLVVREIFSVLDHLNREEGLAVLVVEQNAKIALASVQHAYLLEVGRVALDAPSAKLEKHEGIRASYLGY
jgi:branched-chain amino acid transport system ATP-binding protein